MPKFFDKSLQSAPNEIGEIVVTGENARHISKSLRMCVGENLVMCDSAGRDFSCEIQSVQGEKVVLKVLFTAPSESESSVFIRLFQGVPKGDKFAQVIQKCTEIGVSEFVPVLMVRSISRPDEKSAVKKQERWQKVASQAAQQSRRGIVPKVLGVTDFETAVNMTGSEPTILFYEGGGEPLKKVLGKVKESSHSTVNIFIGPEGGFDPAEVDRLKQANAYVATLGARILRTETAPVVASANILYELEE